MILSFMENSKPWTEYTFVAFDLETSGAYPLGSEIVEFGAVKWRGGQEIETYQTLFHPSEPMSAFNMGIHGITNEMVADAPLISEKIHEIRQFFEGAILMAHHAPFDMGFVAVDFEKYGVSFPEPAVICTSLLSRKVIPESANHKLQTLIKFLGLDGGQAHRGLDDARACLQLGLICMKRVGENATLEEVYQNVSKKPLLWSKYSLRVGGSPNMQMIVQALADKKDVDMIYAGGSLKGTRRITPQGIVRNPDGDYVQAMCHIDRISKRFYFEKMIDPQIVF